MAVVPAADANFGKLQRQFRGEREPQPFELAHELIDMPRELTHPRALA